MESWVKEQLKTFVPALEASSDEGEIAALCEGLVQALRDRGLGSILSYKRPLRELRNAVKELALDEAKEELALEHLSLTEDEKLAINQPSEQKRDERLKHQVFIYRPGEVIERIYRLLQSDQWEEIIAGLCFATGCRLSEVAKFATYRVASLYSVWFGGQRKTSLDREYEKPTLVLAREVVEAWERLRLLRDFSDVPSDSISSSFGPAIKDVIVRKFADLIEVPPGRASLYTQVLRAAYPRLCIYYFLPPRTDEVLYASAILGHVANRDGVLVPNLNSTMYYRTYKIMGENGLVDKGEGVKLLEPGVEILEQFKESEKRTMADTVVESSARTKIGVKVATKAAFDAEQKEMACSTADEAVVKLVEDHKVYRQLEELAGGEMPTLMEILVEALEIKLENETPLETLRAALADKRRFRANYDKRTASNAERDYASMTMNELKNARTTEAARERWRRAVDMIMAYNDQATMPELRWFVNASAVKGLVGGKGTEIGKYLKENRQAELDAHHAKWNLRPGVNHGRTNIRERVLGDDAASMETEDEE
jgi:hypothetical protein